MIVYLNRFLINTKRDPLISHCNHDSDNGHTNDEELNNMPSLSDDENMEEFEQQLQALRRLEADFANFSLDEDDNEEETEEKQQELLGIKVSQQDRLIFLLGKCHLSLGKNEFEQISLALKAEQQANNK